MMDLDLINAMSEADARAAFRKCCGAARWAQHMTERRPFAATADLLAAAEQIWQDFTRANWLEAFAAHPKIGGLDALRTKFANTAAWSANEQAGIDGAADATLRALDEGNRCYETKFGYIFIVCATGKTAAEMLALLEARLKNPPDRELAIAAAEQKKITLLRLERLCS